jgi:uncharacterized protein YkwD
MTREAKLAISLLALAVTALAPASAHADLSRFIAPTSACPKQRQAAAPAGVQLREMRCMTNFARHTSGLSPLTAVAPLNRAAGHKAADIIACRELSHEACGRASTYWMEHFGYLGGGCWRAAENIAWGSRDFASVRAIFRSWIGSTGHRENILGPYAQIGIGLRVGNLEGSRGAHVWVQEFGSHDC